MKYKAIIPLATAHQFYTAVCCMFRFIRTTIWYHHHNTLINISTFATCNFSASEIQFMIVY